MSEIERISVKDLMSELHKYPNEAIVELIINVDWCDNYGGGNAKLKVIDGKRESTIMEVEE